MRQVLLFSVLISSLAAKSSTSRERLQALWNLEEESECVLHYRALVYNNYGCWCGVGGSHEPVDEIDRCCMNHDKCYDAAVDNKVCFDVPWEYVDSYKWKCVNGTAICAEAQDDCKSALCACDVAVVNCWAKYPKPQQKARCNRSNFLATDAEYFQL
ncbi:hypothetical protein Q1695_011511 [Nippostrongylus brasiliensis]|nr:hypothetical protein Q1695_011511 [Nippostrongylus brasiliensis]